MSRGKKSRRKVLLKTPRVKNKFKKKNTDDSVDREFKESRWVSTIIDLMMQGFSNNYIKSYLAESKHEKLHSELVAEYMLQASRTLSLEYSNKTKSIQAIHVKRYNSTIREKLETEELDQSSIGDVEEGGITWEDWIKSRQRKIAAFMICIDTMFRKEKCLQMHSKTFVVEINEEIEINLSKKPKLDIAKLSFTDQIELLELIQKSKKGVEELMSVSEPIVNPENDIVDTEAEVVGTKVNIEGIKHEAPEVPKYTGELVADPSLKLKQALVKLAANKLTKDNPNAGIKVIDHR